MGGKFLQNDRLKGIALTIIRYATAIRTIDKLTRTASLKRFDRMPTPIP